MVGVRQVYLNEEQVVLDISRDTVLYRCIVCRSRYSVTTGHPLFLQVGHGVSATRKCLAWWSFSEGKSATVTARELEVDYKLMLEWYQAAETITMHDALEKADADPFWGQSNP